jgi:hypothetical protein
MAALGRPEWPVAAHFVWVNINHFGRPMRKCGATMAQARQAGALVLRGQQWD